MKVLIVCAGEEPNKELITEEKSKSDYCIAVDGGARCYYKYNIVPDLLVGDMDSLDQDIFERFVEKNIECIKYKPEKDYTDTELAILKAIQIGASTITLMGVTGGRFDHTYANISLMHKYTKNGIEVIIKDNSNIIYVKDKCFRIKKKSKYVSFYCLSEFVEGLSLYGFKYNLCDYKLTKWDILCTSNEIVESEGCVDFDSGLIMVVESEMMKK